MHKHDDAPAGTGADDDQRGQRDLPPIIPRAATARLRRDAARTGDFSPDVPGTHAAIVAELRAVDDDRLHILIDRAAHFEHLAAEVGVDHSPTWLAGQRAWAAAARTVLDDRERRGYRYVPGRMRYDRALLDTIRDRIDLVALVGRTVNLVPQGRAHIGLCPYHDERTPSFAIYPDGRYHCFGCFAWGDAIDWIMYLEGGTFGDAVRTAAALAGVDLPETNRQSGRPSLQRRAVR